MIALTKRSAHGRRIERGDRQPGPGERRRAQGLADGDGGARGRGAQPAGRGADGEAGEGHDGAVLFALLCFWLGVD